MLWQQCVCLFVFVCSKLLPTNSSQLPQAVMRLASSRMFYLNGRRQQEDGDSFIMENVLMFNLCHRSSVTAVTVLRPGRHGCRNSISGTDRFLFSAKPPGRLCGPSSF
jgi:hypothetical protein